MPIFEYNCNYCKQNFESLVFSTKETVQCPHCGSQLIEKQLSTFGVSMGTSIPDCAGGRCGLPQPPAGCGEGACPGCLHG